MKQKDNKIINLLFKAYDAGVKNEDFNLDDACDEIKKILTQQGTALKP